MDTKLVTIVTGGGRGIGRAIALRLARLTSVLVVGRHEDDLRTVCATINSAGGEADYVVGDVSDAATAARAVIKCGERGWVITNLVCNAGIAKGGPLATFDAGVWEEMFAVNVHGAFHFARACLPSMIERKRGAITIISSTLGLKGHKNDAAYSATKFALMGLAQSLADEVKKHNIVVVPICPGFVDTDMTRRSVAGLVKHRGISEAEAEKILAATNPQGRILQPEEIAEAVAYISSDQREMLARSGEAMLLTEWNEPRVLQLINWIRETAAPARKLLIPISGGSDSALAFYLCSKAYPDKTIGVFVGKAKDLRCRQWFESVGTVQYESVTRNSRNKKNEHHGDAEIARWARFLTLSNSLDAWLVGSRNRTENYTGLYSLASRVATFLPLGQVWKSQVMTLCNLIGVPPEVTASSRQADPDCGRPLQMAAIPLEKIDIFTQVKVGERSPDALQALTPEECLYLNRVIEQNAFKRDLPTLGPILFAA